MTLPGHLMMLVVRSHLYISVLLQILPCQPSSPLLECLLASQTIRTSQEHKIFGPCT
jgi:hypothetical protein